MVKKSQSIFNVFPTDNCYKMQNYQFYYFYSNNNFSIIINVFLV